MKFLCLACDRAMEFAERRLPGDGTLAAVFGCPACGREIAMLTNPMETQLVSSLGIKVGGREVPEQPLELVRSSLAGGRPDAFLDEATPAGPPPAGPVTWSEEALQRLGHVPAFVRGMVKRIYTDYARERGIDRVTPETMDRARTDLGLEGM
ncbi:MAG TPA: PCP reductase family protein [Longimicrobiales bacterium]|nr:PCP reductase family protein [Longimicrobiales bacterium]